jgi:tetratricopeptide (TPR) repeat protein
MTDTKRNSGKQWSGAQALAVTVVCLAAGVAGGWFFHTWQDAQAAGDSKAAVVPAQATATTAGVTPGAAQMKQMADAQARPLIDKLKSDPNNAALLAAIGNLYYDVQQYPVAVDYYGRALAAKPADAAVRTDLGTSYWYMGNADQAIAEFNKALSYEPTNPNTLFNRGLVKWKAKNDAAGAEADWNKLLATNPNYQGRDKVAEMMAEARSAGAGKP